MNSKWLILLAMSFCCIALCVFDFAQLDFKSKISLDELSQSHINFNFQKSNLFSWTRTVGLKQYDVRSLMFCDFITSDEKYNEVSLQGRFAFLYTAITLGVFNSASPLLYMSGNSLFNSANTDLVAFAIILIILLIYSRHYFITTAFGKNKLSKVHLGLEQTTALAQMNPGFFTNISYDSPIHFTLARGALEKKHDAPNKKTILSGLSQKDKKHFTEKSTTQNYDSKRVIKDYINDQYIDREDIHKTLNNDKPLILIVDDNYDDQALMREFLMNEGFNCLQSFDGNEALELCRKHLPDLVITEVVMPGVNGFELCYEIKNDENIWHIPVVMLTTRTSDADHLTGLNCGAEAYIYKPFNIQILIAQIKSILAARSLLNKKKDQKLNVRPSEVKITSTDEKLIGRLLEIVEKNIDNSDFRVFQLADEVGMSQPILNKKLKALLGQTANVFIRSIRLKRAAQLLKLNHLSVTDVIYEVGFNDVKYFRECFRKEFGTTPTEYMNQHSRN